MTMRPTRRALLAAAAYLPALGLGIGSGQALAATTSGLDSLAHTLLQLSGRGPVWAGAPQGEAQRMAMLALLNREHRLDPDAASDTFALASMLASDDPAVHAQGEQILTREALAYLGRRSGGGQVDTAMVSNALELMSAAVADSELDVALLELRVTAVVGGWQPVGSRTLPPRIEEAAYVPGAEMQPQPRPRVIVDQDQLRLRLTQSMDLPVRFREGKLPPGVLTQAVKTFQQRNGLAADGNPAGRTLAALNAPIVQLIERVALNVDRRALLAPRAALPGYVEVNIPSYELKLVRQGRTAMSMRVVVGDRETETPIFDDLMRHIDVNPSWYVPPSIVKEMTDKFAADPGYFDRNGFVWRANGGLVQKPGPENALGRFKFLFPNHHAVYLHDTQQRKHFGRAERSLSHGCIRVEQPLELAAAILGPQGWDEAKLGQVLDRRRTRRIDLAEPLPVFLDYFTTLVDEDGRLRVLRDLYGHDARRQISWPEKQTPAGGPLTPPPVPEIVPTTVEPDLPSSASAPSSTPVATASVTQPDGAQAVTE